MRGVLHDVPPHMPNWRRATGVQLRATPNAKLASQREGDRSSYLELPEA